MDPEIPERLGRGKTEVIFTSIFLLCFIKSCFEKNFKIQLQKFSDRDSDFPDRSSDCHKAQKYLFCKSLSWRCFGGYAALLFCARIYKNKSDKINYRNFYMVLYDRMSAVFPFCRIVGFSG